MGDVEEARRVRQLAQEALYGSAIILGFGGLFWATCKTIDIVSDIMANTQAAISEAMNVVIPSSHPPLHPKMVEDDAWTLLWERQLAKYGPLHPNSLIWWADMVAYRRLINEDGSLKPMRNHRYLWLKRHEQTLIDIGYKSVVEAEAEVVKVNVLDKVVDFVANDRRYSLGVLGISILPAAHVGIEVAEYMRGSAKLSRETRK